MGVLIKRLKQNNQEFVPITAEEAVVVNSNNLGLNLGITTLDKVLKAYLILLDLVADEGDTNNQNLILQINELLASKQDKLTPGTGIEISDEGVISLNHSFDIYKIASVLPTASASEVNIIYLIPNSDSADSLNLFSEFLCVQIGEESAYKWEKIGEFKADVDLSGYLTTAQFGSYVSTQAISTENVYYYDESTSQITSETVSVQYDMPSDIYKK